MNWLAIALGGALGAMARYGMGRLLAAWPAFPYATLLVNVLGSLAAGWCYARLVEQGPQGTAYALLSIGFLGAFTTFSAFSIETVRLIDTGQFGLAVLNVALNVTVCVVAAAGGLAIGRGLAG